MGSAIILLSNNTTLILKGCTVYSEGNYAVSIGFGSNATFKIQGESPVVLQGKRTRAAYNAPDLSGYTGIIHASTNVDGSQSQVISAEVLNNNINPYKYLAFTPGNPKIRNATTNAFYDNLQTAFDEVREGETIELVGDLTLAETVEIPAGDDRSFILDLNNHTLDGGSGTGIRHNGGGTSDHCQRHPRHRPNRHHKRRHRRNRKGGNCRPRCYPGRACFQQYQFGFRWRDGGQSQHQPRWQHVGPLR
ncbi:MAG: hypothetical protein ACOX0K_01825 [Oscillospiraceae bacterium]